MAVAAVVADFGDMRSIDWQMHVIGAEPVTDPKPEKRATDKLSLARQAWSSEAKKEDPKVAKKGHSEEQILRALRQAEGGTRVADICREHGISEATYYIWKKKYSGLGLNELRELRQLRDENGKLKRLVADLSLDRGLHPENSAEMR